MAISFQDNQTLNIYPNPITDIVTIENTEAGQMAQVINVNGEVVLTFQTEARPAPPKRRR